MQRRHGEKLIAVVELRSLQPGGRVTEHAHRGGGGSPLLSATVADCIILTFGNAAGRIASAPFWSERRSAVAGLVRGDAVEVAGEIRVYRGRRQLEVWSIRAAAPRARWSGARLLPSVGDVGPYWEHLDRWRGAIAAPRLRQVLAVFYENPEFRAHFAACPASTAGHHAQLGGLLRHTYEVTMIARDR